MQFLGKFGAWLAIISFSLLLLIVCVAYLAMIFKGIPNSKGPIGDEYWAGGLPDSSSDGGAS